MCFLRGFRGKGKEKMGSKFEGEVEVEMAVEGPEVEPSEVEYTTQTLEQALS